MQVCCCDFCYPCDPSPHSVFRISPVTSDWCRSGCCGGCSKTRRLPPLRSVSWSPCWRAFWTTPRTRTPVYGLKANTPSSTCCSSARETKPFRSAYRHSAAVYVTQILFLQFLMFCCFFAAEYYSHSGLCEQWPAVRVSPPVLEENCQRARLQRRDWWHHSNMMNQDWSVNWSLQLYSPRHPHHMCPCCPSWTKAQMGRVSPHPSLNSIFFSSFCVIVLVAFKPDSVILFFPLTFIS